MLQNRKPRFSQEAFLDTLYFYICMILTKSKTFPEVFWKIIISWVDSRDSLDILSAPRNLCKLTNAN